MDIGGVLFPHQSLGNRSSLLCPSVLPKEESFAVNPDHAGQSDSDFLPESYGSLLVPPGTQNLKLVLFTPHADIDLEQRTLLQITN